MGKPEKKAVCSPRCEDETTTCHDGAFSFAFHAAVPPRSTQEDRGVPPPARPLSSWSRSPSQWGPLFIRTRSRQRQHPRMGLRPSLMAGSMPVCHVPPGMPFPPCGLTRPGNHAELFATPFRRIQYVNAHDAVFVHCPPEFRFRGYGGDSPQKRRRQLQQRLQDAGDHRGLDCQKDILEWCPLRH